MKTLILNIIAFLLLTDCSIHNIQEGLTVTIVSEAPVEDISVYYDKFDIGGNTSIANDKEDIFKYSGPGNFTCEDFGYFNPQDNEIPYIKRDRDLGQTFKIYSGKDVILKSITLKTGYGSNIVRSGTYGEPVALQLFEVTGRPEIKNNGTDGLINPGHNHLKGRYLKFSIAENLIVRLKKDKQYAFLVMLVNRADLNSFTLANSYTGNYEGGHGIRRDGNGEFPPVKGDPTKDFKHSSNRKAYKSAHFPVNIKQRAKIKPGTNGYPDVDTWRDLVFYIETKPVN